MTPPLQEGKNLASEVGDSHLPLGNPQSSGWRAVHRKHYFWAIDHLLHLGGPHHLRLKLKDHALGVHHGGSHHLGLKLECHELWVHHGDSHHLGLKLGLKLENHELGVHQRDL